MNCIRCGASLHQEGRLLATDSGDCTCPASHPGEAAIHRLGERAKAHTGRPSNAWVAPVAKAGVGFLAGRVVGNLLLGGAPKTTPMQPSVPGDTQVDQAANFFRSRMGG